MPHVTPARLFGLLLLMVNGHCSAQTDGRGWFRFQYDNDFFNATDRYYTQGIQLELAAPFMDRSPMRHVLLNLGEGAAQQHVLFAQQDCFTPSSIRRDTILRTDRPFAAALYIGQRSISTDTEHKRILTSSISLGVIGPCALCAEEQIGIHRALNNITPLGWPFQVRNDVILNYAVDLDQRFYRNAFAELSGGAHTEAGTYRTNGDVHARLELGRFASLFDADAASAPSFRFSVFVAGAVRAIAYEASFQGGLFDRSSPHTLSAEAMERGVMRGEGGVRLRYRSFGLIYAKTFTTREFVDGLDHGWGTCVITAFF